MPLPSEMASIIFQAVGVSAYLTDHCHCHDHNMHVAV